MIPRATGNIVALALVYGETQAVIPRATGSIVYGGTDIILAMVRQKYTQAMILRGKTDIYKPYGDRHIHRL